MFTGIIEDLGEVTGLNQEGTNLHIHMRSRIAAELKIDQSLSHNGVCLTIVALGDGTYTVTAIEETLKKTNLGSLDVGSKVNLERAMPAHGRFDGHMVQGHVDQTAICTEVTDHNGSWVYRFRFQPGPEYLLVNKGSICIDGVSLTVVEATNNEFTVAIIPYTYEHTCFHLLKVGDHVNLEFDIIGKYMARHFHNYARK
jgi:riboflavin synthase